MCSPLIGLEEPLSAETPRCSVVCPGLTSPSPQRFRLECSNSMIQPEMRKLPGEPNGHRNFVPITTVGSGTEKNSLFCLKPLSAHSFITDWQCRACSTPSTVPGIQWEDVQQVFGFTLNSQMHIYYHLCWGYYTKTG